MAWRKLVVLEGRISLSLLCSHTRKFCARIGLRFFSRLCYSALLHSTLVIRKANAVSRTGALQPPPILVSVITCSRFFSQSLPQDKILKVFKQTSLHKPNWIIDSRTLFCAYNHFSSIYIHARGPTRRLLKPNHVFSPVHSTLLNSMLVQRELLERRCYRRDFSTTLYMYAFRVTSNCVACCQLYTPRMPLSLFVVNTPFYCLLSIPVQTRHCLSFLYSFFTSPTLFYQPCANLSITCQVHVPLPYIHAIQ
jgi:hypothetical protein